MLEEEEDDTPAADEVTIIVPPVTQPIVSRNSDILVGVNEDPGLKDLVYPRFRAALDSRFNFDPNLTFDQNKKMVQE